MKRFGVAALAMVVALGCSRKSDTIVMYGRDNSSGTYAYFKEHVLENEDFAAHVQGLPGTAAVINAVSKDPKSIGYGGIGYAKGVRVLPVRKDKNSPAVEPTIENVISGAYPISRYLYFYTVGEPQGAVRHYMRWVLSTEGQKVCEDVGYYPLPAQSRHDLGSTGSPDAKTSLTVKGSDTMVILGQRWAEHFMGEEKNIVVQVTGGGSGTGIAALINGSTDICQSSRPMKDPEKKKIREKFGKNAFEIKVAMDGLAIFVHEENSIQDISLEQLKGIYTSKIKGWKELGE